MINRIIFFGFFGIFFLTPIFFTPFNNELFEFNKMILVYSLTTVILGLWILKCLNKKSLILKKTPLDIPILLFVLSQVLSTIFSIDQHTSWWGYYSRSNGGLLSILSYVILYYALVSNIDRKGTFKLLKSALLGGLVVALWAIPEHFGVSPSCMLLTQQITADCWVQDVQARVFATLGQPNWLAAYIGMLIFPAIYFFLTAITQKSRIFYLILVSAFYLAFTFTYSRGATLGLIAGLIVLVLGIYLPAFFSKEKMNTQSLKKPLLIIFAIFLIINLFFGSTLTRFKLITEKATLTPQTPTAMGVTQLESGGTESGSIRLIVWEGALDIWKAHPFLGSGVETFAYAYYNHRPVAHNLVSEWDFLYNKAHNEYLNYLATTGILGLGTYLLMVGVFGIWSIFKILDYRLLLSDSYKLQLLKNTDKLSSDKKLIIVTLLASYTSYLVQNFFGFSVVMIALLFYLIPAFVFNLTIDLSAPSIYAPLKNILVKILHATVYRNRFFQIIAQTIVIIWLLMTLLNITGVWYADTNYKKGVDFVDTGNVTSGYNYLIRAAIQNPNEPLYRSELGFAAAGSALLYQQSDATLAGELKNEAVIQTERALSISPKNLSLHRTAVRTYYQLSALDPKFLDRALQEIDLAISLAPTDPKLYYNKALILGNSNKKEDAIKILAEVIALKPNYREAYLSKGFFEADLQKYDDARKSLNTILKLVPNDPEALEKLKEIEDK